MSAGCGGNVTHVIAQDAESMPFKAHMRADKHDMIDVRWLLECGEQQRLVPLRPRHYLHLTRGTMASSPNMTPYGDMCAPLNPPLTCPLCSRFARALSAVVSSCTDKCSAVKTFFHGACMQLPPHALGKTCEQPVVWSEEEPVRLP